MLRGDISLAVKKICERLGRLARQDKVQNPGFERKRWTGWFFLGAQTPIEPAIEEAIERRRKSSGAKCKLSSVKDCWDSAE